MKNLLFLFLIVFLFSCEKENIAVKDSETNAIKNLPVVCNVKDPVNNLTWLRNQVNDFKQSAAYLNEGFAMNIWVSNYKGQELFIIYIGNELSNGVATYYACTGQSYCDYSNKPCPDYNEFDKKILPRVKFHTVISK